MYMYICIYMYTYMYLHISLVLCFIISVIVIISSIIINPHCPPNGDPNRGILPAVNLNSLSYSET